MSGHISTEQKHILTLHEQQHIFSSVMIHSNHTCMLSGIVAESMNSLTVTQITYEFTSFRTSNLEFALMMSPVSSEIYKHTKW